MVTLPFKMGSLQWVSLFYHLLLSLSIVSLSAIALGRSPLDVQRQMGHKTLKMTNRYASLTVEQLRVKVSGINRGPGRGNWDE
jgi:hypothetical protein